MKKINFSMNKLAEELPWNDCYEYFAPDFNLHGTHSFYYCSCNTPLTQTQTRACLTPNKLQNPCINNSSFL